MPSVVNVYDDKAFIQRYLEKEGVYLHLYEIGDLDDFFWPFTKWYALSMNSNKGDSTFSKESLLCSSVAAPIPTIEQLVMLYSQGKHTLLLALGNNIAKLRELVSHQSLPLPLTFQAHLSVGVFEAIQDMGIYNIDHHGQFYKMALLDTSIVLSTAITTAGDTHRVVRLQEAQRGEVEQFFAESYPGNWFEARMLQVPMFGLRDALSGLLVAVAGVHVYSQKYGVASLGNVATHPKHRGKGYAKLVVAALAQHMLLRPLHSGHDDSTGTVHNSNDGSTGTDAICVGHSDSGSLIQHIGMNVSASNIAALKCYESLGFEVVARYEEINFSCKNMNKHDFEHVIKAKNHHHQQQQQQQVQQEQQHQGQWPAELEVNPYGPLKESTIEFIERWLTTDEDHRRQHCPVPWEVSREGRRVAQFGSARYDYAQQCVVLASLDSPLPALPPILSELLLSTTAAGYAASDSYDSIITTTATTIAATEYTQCIVNEYGPDDAIPWHTDDNVFGPKILVFVLGEHRPLMMRQGSSEIAIDVSGGSYLMQGPSRYHWEHCVKAGSGRRISITFRSTK